MAKAENGNTVKVHYTGTLDDGSIFDSSRGGDPLQFTLGEGQLIPMFEETVIGMEAGETRKVHIPAAEAYGERSEELLLEVPREHLPAEQEPEVGMQLQVMHESGMVSMVEIVEVRDDSVVLDANHQLAGMDLNFEIELVEIEGASRLIIT